MNNILAKLYRESFDQPPLNNPLFPPSIYYRFLQTLAQQLKPGLSVELGVSGGGGSLHLALGYPEGDVIGIDIAPIPQPQLTTIIEMAGNNFYFWLGDSVDIAPDIYKWFGEVDILFIDTVHTREQTWQEYNAWKPYLSDRAIVCFDDLLRPEMRGFWEELPEPKMRMDKLHDGAENGGGFGVIWRGQ